MGVNLRQGVSDAVYNAFVEGSRDTLILQSNDYYTGKLKGKKYLWLVNEELPEKPEARFSILSVEEAYGGAQEDIYGQYIMGPHLLIVLRKREKTK